MRCEARIGAEFEVLAGISAVLRMTESYAAKWRRHLPMVRAAGLGVVLPALWFATAFAQTNPTNLNFYGSPGLLDMPGGHMSPDGAFNIWAAGTDFTQRYGFSFQATPWFEGSFRYIATRQLLGYPTYYDRSFGVRIRLQNETAGWPDIALGVSDIVGTGLESGEYVVASKHLGPFDATLGLGWGRLASAGGFENPFAVVASSFSSRPPPTAAGQFDVKDFFHGPHAAFFGGVAWATPLDRLTALVEYSSDAYSLESQQHVFTPAMQVNFGLSYQVTPALQVGAAWMYGRLPMLRIAGTLDPKTEPFDRRFGETPIAPHIRDAEELRRIARAKRLPLDPGVQSFDADGSTLIAFIKAVRLEQRDCGRHALLADVARENGFQEVAISSVGDPYGDVLICSAGDGLRLIERRMALFTSSGDADPGTGAFAEARAHAIEFAAKQGLKIEAIALHGDRVDVAFTNLRYRTEPEAYGRLARVLMATMPDNIDTFRIISLAEGMPTRELVLPRSSLERTIEQSGGGREVLADVTTDQTSILPAQISEPVAKYPAFDWSLSPVYNQSLFDPDAPYLYQLLVGLRGGVNLTPQLRFEGEVQANIVSTFNQLRSSNSALPHVRSDQNLYYDKGRNGVAELQSSYETTLAPGVYALARGGILESMFAGGGGEILWRPETARWAFGATLYEVWQRGFDRLFDMQPYHVLTGHVSLYYESPWYNLDFRADAGRYLAGDEGGTLTVSRRFDTGVEIGVFATLTNVPFAKFGEGSFDKGFVIRIPLDFVTPLNSQSEFDVNLRPVTRDGGQMLQPEQVLYDETRRTSYGEFLSAVDRIPSP